MITITEFILESLSATERFGTLLGASCEAGDILCLKGDLGAGKTALAKAIAIGVGVDSKEYVTSPTFGVCHQYNGTLPLYHMDFYRLKSSTEVIEMGLEEYFYLSGIAVIEWYEIALDIIPADYLKAELTVIDETKRRVLLSSDSEGWQKRILLLKQQI